MLVIGRLPQALVMLPAISLSVSAQVRALLWTLA